MEIPSRDDWGEAWRGLDEASAFANFHGKSLREALLLFEEFALGYQEDLHYMPEMPFKYYLRAYVHYLWSDKSRNDSSGAGCFVGLIRSQLRKQPGWLNESWPRIERVLRKIAENPEFYGTDTHNYRNLSKQIQCLLDHRPGMR